ncbi:MAG TPA: carbohydrate ABC transporter permease, partial [Mesotoga sp.]|nr:carbohydrate ABC transporter permease [Mesotoga sp.]
MKRTRRETLVKTVVAWIVALIWILPLMGVVMTALRPFSEVIDGWWKLEPFNATLSNFSGALNHRTAALYKGMINSLMIAIPATIAPLLLATLAGYGIS